MVLSNTLKDSVLLLIYSLKNVVPENNFSYGTVLTLLSRSDEPKKISTMSWRTRFGARNAGRDSKDRCCCRMCPLREGVVLIGAWKVIEFFFGSISLLSGYLHGGITPIWLAVGFLFETFLLACTLMLFVGLRRRIAVLLLPFLVLQILILISMFIIVMYSVWLLKGERSPLDEEMEVDNIFTNFTLHALLKGNKLDFHLSMNPSEAAQFYCTFVDKLRQNYREDLVKDVMSSKSNSLQEFMVICYPGIVKNVDKALESLGGMKEIEKHKAGSLELNFHRKSNVFSRPALSRPREGAFLIIRARRLIQASPSSSKQATYSVQLEVVGTLSSIHDFNSSLFDFQYLPMRKNENGQYSEIYSALVPSTKEQAERWFTPPIPDPELFLIPFSFTRLFTASESILSREVTNYDLETPGRAAETATDEFPAEPSPLAMKQVKRNTFDPAVHEALEKAFNERPMWLKYSLIVKLKLDERDVRRLLPKFAFHIISGPWGRNWCRYKYDPREDTNSWKFQTMHFPFFRFGGESALSEAFVKWHLKVSSIGIRSSKEWDKLLTTEPTFQYTEGCLPSLRSMWYQMCDIHLPAVEELLSYRLRENQAESHPTDGWLKSGTLDEIRELIKLDFKKTIDTLNARASQSKADKND
ncbi:General transcription factor 3C polypeptide 5 [Trichinella papuae]|uniref:D-aminoacyl-tRNA deacylase n=1 Tax=Trichinella papuae TaxID=268474 RepID=A0A0V1MRW9_9BILA|nr:General transcription factor 3C polypeptide 5 [Trichinella papuae]